MKKGLMYTGLIILLLCSAFYIGYRTYAPNWRYLIKNEAVHYKGWSSSIGYFDEHIISADPNSFKILQNPFYGKDKKSVFYQGKIIKQADPQSFSILDDLYAKDKWHAFFQGKLMVSSLGASFHLLDNDYSTDGTDVFYRGIALKVQSTKNFRFISQSPSDEKNGYRLYPWATDGYYYYYKNYKIPSDDYAHVVVFPNSEGIAKDKTWVYYQDRKINFNEKGEKLYEVDAPSFVSKGALIDGGQDKDGCIEANAGRIKCD